MKIEPLFSRSKQKTIDHDQIKQKYDGLANGTPCADNMIHKGGIT
jgi:hypothetical protein